MNSSTYSRSIDSSNATTCVITCALAKGLPRGLSELHLCLGDCQIGDAGAIALGEHFPEGLSKLSLVLWGCMIGRIGAKVLEVSAPAGVNSPVFHDLSKIDEADSDEEAESI